MSVLHMNLGPDSYDIHVERGCLERAGELMNLDRRVLVVTDSGVPKAYARRVAAQCREAHVEVIPEGEASKCVAMWQRLLSAMLAHGFTRRDCVVAVGGGVVGDLAGFAAASFMRGIDFYNIPTTVLSQVDSSIGGKTAIDLDGIKNIVGAFHQPKCVLVDPDTLATLPARQVSNGLAEAVKMGLTSDADLFALFERGDALSHMEEVITASLRVKQAVVEADEKEQGLRKVLNFGHTIGHGIESFEGLNGLYHGECVALGMLPVCGEALRPRVQRVLEGLHLPTRVALRREAVRDAMQHDKKSAGGTVTETFVSEPGSFTFREVTVDSLVDRLGCIMEEEA